MSEPSTDPQSTSAHPRTALVTGASRGIGRAVAVGLAHDGFALVGIHYSSALEEAERTAELVRGAGATPVLLHADLSESPVDKVRQIASDFLGAAQEHIGERTVTALVNNAGMTGEQDLAGLDSATYERVIAVNLTAPLFLIQSLQLELGYGGRVVNISTGYNRFAAPTHLAYAAAKAGLSNLTLALAPTLAIRQITINAVMPGVIDTHINASWLAEPGAREHAALVSAFGRIGEADDVSDLARFLISDAARWTTGQTIDVSGGSNL
jgi:NAD(P)-dependent dehydrogenase (short-subunit alcohol dehydrogenase family)